MSGSSILLVDDDRNATELLRHLLAKAGFKGALKTLQDAASALHFIDEAIAAGTLPGLVLVDLSLPGTHGFDLVRAMRHRLQNSSTFIAVLSASDNDADIHGAFSVGADAYLEKFPSVEELGRIHAIVNNGSRPRDAICLLHRGRRTPAKFPYRGLGP